MGSRIRGITVTLYDKEKTGTDKFGRAIYSETPVSVDNVLVGEPSTEAVIDELNLTGKHIAYTLAIPKGDLNTWTDRKVGFFGELFRVIGEPTQGIEDNIPLSWNKKVRVERYE